MSNLKAVAEHSKVSIATVSRVINNDPKVSKATMLKVQASIAALEYKPNRVAQRLRSTSKKTKLLGLVIPDIQNPFFVDVVRGVEDYAYQNNFAVMIGNFGQDEKKEKLYLDILQSENIDGLIVAPIHGKDKGVENLVKKNIPVVCIDRGLTDVDVDVVKVNNEQGAFSAISHLLSIGHKRIAFISGNFKIPTYIERLSGYKKALSEYGVAFDESLVFARDTDYKSGFEIANKILELDNRPTAIFSGNNLLTLGALEAIHAKSIKIPEDISIVGFDDMPWSISLNPPLSAVRQPGFDMGRKAAEMLYERIVNPTREKENVILKTELMLRKSTAPIV
ncbi:LacI family transcriptional regulator [Flavobacterium glycines]|uniref:LacI family transcriptional regulator n=1 Tax=Flavobacterium glycines TaxID=551990 RepID=A0A1B9DPV3_9FLAO|nr:LacI family DNA-binding transcriptional regulator [Flavobacterium glycines]OCB71722.1 LacI family transcriptional regulator [Flavobacterium glycines]GEL10774.1 LacI family transcriptional regulator [Flavobacterium glycines]